MKNVPLTPFLNGLKDPSARVRATAAIGLGRLGRGEAIPALLSVKVPSSFVAPPKGKEGPHFTPNAAIIPAHVAARALVNLNAVSASVKAIGTANNTMALWVLRSMHDPIAVRGLIAAYNNSTNKDLKKQILESTARLYKTEMPYTGDAWWSTKPNGHGPYYRPIDWELSPVIKTFLLGVWNKSDAEDQQFLTDLNEKHQMGIAELGVVQAVAVKDESKVDLEAIRNKKGQIGNSSIEDVMLAMAKIKGDPTLGKALFTRQGCVVCHSVTAGEALKGPFMGQIGGIMNREQIAESILKPNASISQGFVTVLITTKDKKDHMGFVTSETPERIIMRDITGQISTVRTADILTRKEMETSMMPAGLANALSYEEFASLIT